MSTYRKATYGIDGKVTPRRSKNNVGVRGGVQNKAMNKPMDQNQERNVYTILGVMIQLSHLCSSSWNPHPLSRRRGHSRTVLRLKPLHPQLFALVAVVEHP